ncbi:hydrogen peroxide-inducible genes activator [Chthonobacter albigriseus]|uniref:hydrogen peroxide-inducible genes activator n=1 Tax=Chthonobacter albigriseus TaxID=1683161 RepID=UPI0015EF2337|nr:hydrogen peroxide-inducible genes activator [Chthonobacter albigriseus]
MKITLRQLRYLDALATEQHFGRAAERSAVSQPALSAQIRDLEALLGVTLVERLPTGARLTRVGAEVAARARAILGDVGDLESYARAQSGDLAGPFRLGLIPSIAPFLLPRLLPILGDRFPRMELAVRETVTGTLVEELVAGDLDLVIASVPLDHPALEEMPLFDDCFLLATPRQGPYALASADSAGQIPAEALLLLEDGHCLRDQTLKVCGALDMRKLRNTGLTSLTTILQLVAAGQGITLLPEMFLENAAMDQSAIRLNRFAGPEPKRTVGLAWRRSSPLTPLFERLGDVVARCASGHQSEHREGGRAGLSRHEAAAISPQTSAFEPLPTGRRHP